MALASTTWADFSPGRPDWSAERRRQASAANAAALGALAAVCTVAAAVMALHAANVLRFPVHPLPVTGALAPLPLRPASAPVSPLARNAEAFLGDSLLLTKNSGAAHARAAAEVAEAKTLGRFGPGDRPLATGPALGTRFEPPAAAPPAPEIAQPGPSVPSGSVRVAPTVTVPLPSPMPGAAAPAPVPAPRPNRVAADTAGLASLGKPLDQVAPPLGESLPAPVLAPLLGRNDGTAIYDISAATVYMPDGTHLEAHSGYGYMADDPRYVDRRNIGPTPPGAYRLESLGGLFHGVEALRMVPVDSKTRYGRDGFLTHTYLLRGRPKQSNGCVVFPNYDRFLEAFKHGRVKRLVVVASLRGSPTAVASAR